MIGLFLVAVATLATEIGCSIGKYTIGTHEKRIFPLGFITHLGGLTLMGISGFLLPANFLGPGIATGFVFSAASIPFLLVRIPLDIAQAHITLLALARAERSAFGFLRTITLPLLLVVDLFLGYVIPTAHLFGVVLITVGLLFLFLNHGIKGKGALLTLFTGVNAVITLSLYKYDITHFNSVATEQSIVMTCVIIYFFILSIFVSKQNPFTLLKHRPYWMQLVTGAIDTVAISFAYLYAPASVITAAKRALSVLWSIGAGNLYFHEKHALVKLGAFVFVAGGTLLLVM